MRHPHISSRRLLIPLVVGIALLIYLLTFTRPLDHYFVSDDWDFLYQSAQVRSLSDVAAFFSYDTTLLPRPLQRLITWLLYSGFGNNPLPYAALPLLLHLTNTLLLGGVAYLLFTSADHNRRDSLLWAAAVSILFVFIPSHHEVVFWYASINELLTALFRLSGILLYLRLLQNNRIASWKYTLGIVVLAILALLCKESPIVFAAELFLFFFYFRIAHPAFKSRRQTWLAPLLVTLVAVAWLVLYWLTAPAGIIETGRGGVKLVPGSLTDWLVRIPLVFNSAIFGLDIISKQGWIWFELLIGVGFAALALVRTRYIVLLALAWTIVIMLPYAALSPASGMLDALRYTALPLPARYFYSITAGSSLFVITVVMWVVKELKSRFSRPIHSRILFAVLSTVLVIFLAYNLRRLWIAKTEWDIAGQIVVRLTRQLEPVIARLESGDTLCLSNLPDNYHLKWTFLNAARGALYLTYQRTDYEIVATTDMEAPRLTDNCTVQLVYDPTAEIFVSP